MGVVVRNRMGHAVVVAFPQGREARRHHYGVPLTALNLTCVAT